MPLMQSYGSKMQQIVPLVQLGLSLYSLGLKQSQTVFRRNGCAESQDSPRQQTTSSTLPTRSHSNTCLDFYNGLHSHTTHKCQIGLLVKIDI